HQVEKPREPGGLLGRVHVLPPVTHQYAALGNVFSPIGVSIPKWLVLLVSSVPGSTPRPSRLLSRRWSKGRKLAEGGMFVMTGAMAVGAAVVALALGTGAGADAKQHASGAFEVKVTPVTGGDNGVASGRLSIAKTYSGDLAATGKADMWTAE